MTQEDPHPPVAADKNVQNFLAFVGQRVRTARSAAGMSRRVLSELSGVSPRYLAQLEAGAGNISIGLLLRVAIALDVPIATLSSGFSQQAVTVARAFDRANPEAQAQIATLLGGRSKGSRICLIGLRGAGKSTLGAYAAKALEVPFIELNKMIEAAAGIEIGEVMALYGSDGYRQLEADALDRIAEQHDRVIVAVAGGIVEETETFDRVLRQFHTIWLKATPEEHMARVRAQGDLRPMEGNPQAMVQLRLLLNSREAEYARADMQLDTSGRSIDQAVAALLELIKGCRFEMEGF